VGFAFYFQDDVLGTRRQASPVKNKKKKPAKVGFAFFFQNGTER